tara:strand:- start:4625 stop:4741 length:117 start_codon:yes stop_codon:yes gene_type:complete
MYWDFIITKLIEMNTLELLVFAQEIAEPNRIIKAIDWI